jgi:hypothetical protein
MVRYNVTYVRRNGTIGVANRVSPMGKAGLFANPAIVVLCAIPVTGAVVTRRERVAPQYPKRYGGRIEGGIVQDTKADRGTIGEIARNLDHHDDDSADAPMRRTDWVATQSGGLGPVDLMKKALGN